MTPNELKSRTELVAELQRMWRMFLCAECPRPAQFWTWIDLHEDNLWRLPSAIAHTAEKEDSIKAKNEVMTTEYAVRYCSSYMNILKTKDEENEEQK